MPPIQPATVQLHGNYLPELLQYFDPDGNPLPDKPCSVDCAICRDPLAIFHPADDSHHTWACLPCGHVFGYECLRTWLSISPLKDCPSCRQGMVHLYCRHLADIEPLQPREDFNIRSLLPVYKHTRPLCRKCNIHLHRGAPVTFSGNPTASGPTGAQLGPTTRHRDQDGIPDPAQQEIVHQQMLRHMLIQGQSFRQSIAQRQQPRQQSGPEPFRPSPPSVNSGLSGANPAARTQSAPAYPRGILTPPSAHSRLFVHPSTLDNWAEFEQASMMAPNALPQAVYDHRVSARVPVNSTTSPPVGSHASPEQGNAEGGSGEVNGERLRSSSSVESPNSPTDDGTTRPERNRMESSPLVQRHAELADGIRRQFGPTPVQLNVYVEQSVQARRLSNEQMVIQLASNARSQARMMEHAQAHRGQARQGFPREGATPGISSQAVPTMARFNSRL